MPRRRLPRVPKLCVRKDGRLYATDPHLKKPVYFKTHDEYEDWRRAFLERIGPLGPGAVAPVPAGPHVTVAGLCALYLEHAKTYYRKDGKTTSEVDIIRMVIRHLAAVLGDKQANDLRPRDVDQVLQHMIAAGLVRRTINKLLAKLKTMLRWAVRQEIVSGETLGKVLAVEGLKKGRTAAREKPKVKPVPLADVEATLPVLRKPVQALVWTQLYSGMRPGEVVRLCAAEIDRSRLPWEYVPASYKTEHHNEDEEEELMRHIYFGPKAREILAPYLEACTDPDAPLFRTRSGRPWTVGKYRCMIYWACARQGVPRWSPHRLRHTMGTAVRKKYGAEAARVYLGQENLKVTEIYSEADQEKSQEIAELMG